MSQNAFEPKTLNGTPWREWTKTAGLMFHRMGFMWWLGCLAPLGLAAFMGNAIARSSGIHPLNILLLCAFLPALGFVMSCALQRGMDRARRGEPAQFFSDITGGIDDVLFGRWGRHKALMSVAIIGGILGFVMLITGTPIKMTQQDPFKHIYMFAFSLMAPVFMFRLRGPLMDFRYHLETWRGADAQTSLSLSDLGSAKNGRVRPQLTLVATLPIWAWIILSINSLSVVAMAGVFLHFLWLTAMDYIIYLEVFEEDGCKLKDMKRVDNLQLAVGGGRL